mmetsp:Transcript_9441/g.13076  ORF Transcript_9441/g.13076 Transcript_9441/m.13076 type:complete len:87 (-) Transcript_9441:213-473(-)
MSIRALISTILEAPTVKHGMSQVGALTKFGLSLLPWGFPAVLVAGWCVYPALTTEFKQSIGLEKVPPSGQQFQFEKEGVGEVPTLS